MADSNLQVFGIEENSFVDGPGMRFAIFLQGCPHHCLGCHNPESQQIGEEYGQSMSVEQILDLIDKNASYISGITISGGEPFLQTEDCIALMTAVKERFPQFQNWIWSGWTYEQLMKKDNAKQLLELMDVLVDGPFILEQRTLEIPWRGSPNQRLIDLNATRNKDHLVLLPE